MLLLQPPPGASATLATHLLLVPYFFQSSPCTDMAALLRCMPLVKGKNLAYYMHIMNIYKENQIYSQV
jgi:hypothetical protein